MHDMKLHVQRRQVSRNCKHYGQSVSEVQPSTPFIVLKPGRRGQVSPLPASQPLLPSHVAGIWHARSQKFHADRFILYRIAGKIFVSTQRLFIVVVTPFLFLLLDSTCTMAYNSAITHHSYSV